MILIPNIRNVKIISTYKNILNLKNSDIKTLEILFFKKADLLNK